MKKRFLNKIRQYFIYGTIYLLPLFLTYFIVYWLFKKIYSFLYNLYVLIPYIKLESNIIKILLVIITIFFIILIIFIIGLIMKTMVGKILLKVINKSISSVPFINFIFNTIKQFLEILFINQFFTFSKVVLTNFPNKENYTIGLITGELKNIFKDNKNYYKIFIPSTPNPTSGFMIMMKEDDIIQLDISIEDSIKFVVTGGVLVKNNNDNVNIE